MENERPFTSSSLRIEPGREMRRSAGDSLPVRRLPVQPCALALASSFVYSLVIGA